MNTEQFINHESTYIKVDNNRIINTNFIRWIGLGDKCFYICNEMDGCTGDTIHQLCKINNPKSFETIKKFFDKVNN
jgi:hypothetical protein